RRNQPRAVAQRADRPMKRFKTATIALKLAPRALLIALLWASPDAASAAQLLEQASPRPGPAAGRAALSVAHARRQADQPGKLPRQAAGAEFFRELVRPVPRGNAADQRACRQ